MVENKNVNIEGRKVRRLEDRLFNYSNIDKTQQTPQPDNSLPSYLPIFQPSILTGDSLKITPKLDEKFDVIYIDPPYFSGIYEKSLEAVKNIAKNIVILEHVTDVDFGDFEILKQKKYGDKYITFLHLFRSCN